MNPPGPGGRDERATVVVDGRTLTVSNLDKPLYPGDGTTKAEVMAVTTLFASTGVTVTREFAVSTSVGSGTVPASSERVMTVSLSKREV